MARGVDLVSSTSAYQTIDKLTTILAMHGVPVTLALDNGPPFTSVHYEAFIKANGIILKRVPPYHPSSNGLDKNLCKHETSLGQKLQVIEYGIKNCILQHSSCDHR